MSVRDIRSHLANLYGVQVSPDLICKVTDAVTEEITTWQNLIESINARLRKVTRNRGHFPSEQAAVKVLYLAIRELIEPKAGGRNHVAAGWRSALNALTLYGEDLITIR